MNYYDTKPYRDHDADPPISLYLIAQPTTGRPVQFDKVSCIWCKRTIYELGGRIDKIINAPMAVDEVDIATQIRCKVCKANYRLIVNAK